MRSPVAVLGLDVVTPTPAEVTGPMPGDDLVVPAALTMDRAFTVRATPEQVWPWVVQLGKRRAGWYLPRRVERWVPRGRRGLRRLDPRWLGLTEGDVIPDWGGRDATFTTVRVVPAGTIVYSSQRGHTSLSWAIRLVAESSGGTRVQLRLRLGDVRHQRVAATWGGLLDLITVAGLAVGLRERLSEQAAGV